MPRLLYLGLDPSRYSYAGQIVHYPIIETVPLRALPPRIVSAWPRVTHLVFTSPRAVRHWFELEPDGAGRTALAIGPGTAAALRERGFAPLVASIPTQEGMVELLRDLPPDSFPLWPRSSASRPLLASHLPPGALVLDLYETRPHCPGPLPDFDDVLFTSPSTVDAFLTLFGALPPERKCRAIGPVTQMKLEEMLRHSVHLRT